jgi:siroheme synthase
LKDALRIAALILCLASFALVSCNTQGSKTASNTTNLTAASTAQTRATPGIASGSITLAVAFYQALTVHDYNKAYSYIDADAQTLDGIALNRGSFIQMAQTIDKAEGQVTEFSAGIDPNVPACVIMSVTRNQRLHYHAHLFLHRDQQQWNILSFDRI